MGLVFGSVPFLLQTKANYTQLGIFSLAAYPYALKLLWSPIVDGFYSSSKHPFRSRCHFLNTITSILFLFSHTLPTLFKGIGRRKSWILPIQFTAGSHSLSVVCGVWCY